jgi:AraC-like DNA-binding protein
MEGARSGLASVVEASPHLDLSRLRSGIEEADRSLGTARTWSHFSNTLSRPISDPAATLLRRIIALAQEPVTLQALAHACQLHERSLRKYCAKHHLPEPNRLIAFGRLLRAAQAIDEGMNVDTVCACLAFPSTEALRKLVSRTLRVPLSRLFQGSAVALVTEQLEAELFIDVTRPHLALVR